MTLTRRDFLKLSGAGLLGLALSTWRVSRVLAGAPSLRRQGRVCWYRLDIYDAPSFSAEILKTYGRDKILPITGEVIGGSETDYNRIWYKIGDEGFAYSGWVQPVYTSYNMPVFEIPQCGALAEITVPVVYVRLQPGAYYRKKFPLYYGATFWVKELVQDLDVSGRFWYRVYDDISETSWYIPSYALRVIPYEELAPLSPNVPNALKSIYVDLASQTLVAFEGDKAVLTSRIASGYPGTETPTGEFLTYHKGPSIHMRDSVGEKVTYDLPGVPWVSFFAGDGAALHGTYWHNDFGTPQSHGCINLPNDAAKFLYLWTLPVVPPDEDYVYKPGEGTLVKIVEGDKE